MVDDERAALAQLKRAQRQSWAEGDYRPVGELLGPAAGILVEAAGVRSGQRVLDVATGSGNVAILAARAGARTVGVDHTDAWFDEARRRATEAGVEVELELGDAEALPMEDGSFDAVLSSFGAIFAPRHEVVAAELARVCRPGGTVAFTAWPPGGANDRLFSVIGESLPPPPPFVTPPIRWGDPDHVREMFAPHDVTFRFERPTFTVEFPTPEDFEAFTFANSGPVIAARRALEELGRWEDTYEAAHDALMSVNEAEDGTFRSTWGFLLAIGTRNG